MKIHGVKGIIKNFKDQNKYLLAIHNNTDARTIGKWTFLGGGIEEHDESYSDTLQRELIEEVNLKLKIEKEIGAFEYKYKNRIYFVIAATALGEPTIVSDEIIEIDWFTYEQIVEMRNNNLLHTEFEVEAIEQYMKLISVDS